MARKVDNNDNIQDDFLYSESEISQIADELGTEIEYDPNVYYGEQEEELIEEDNDEEEEFYEIDPQEANPQYEAIEYESVDYDEEEYEEEEEDKYEELVIPEPVQPQPKPKKKKVKPKAPSQIKKQQRKPKKPTIDLTKKPETLAEFEALEAYKKSPEYKEHLAEQQKAKQALTDPAYVRGVLDKSRVDITDLGSITIQDEARTITDKDTSNYLRSADPTYQIVLNQSAYTADMKSLKFKDIFALSNSVTNTYSGALDKYQTYFRAIADNSLGIKDFDTWAKVTSLYDVSTLEFGIFNQTFPGETELDIRCSKCRNTMRNVAISNDYLISTRNDEVYEQLDRVINNINDLEKASEYSLVNKINRFQLPDSSAIIDIHIPTVSDYLKLLEQTPDGEISAIENYVDVLLFIKDVYLVDIQATEDEGKPVFYPLKTRNDVLAFLKEMSLDDISKVNREIGDKDRKFRIDYQVQSFACQNCGEPTGNIDIDIESLLFEQAIAKLVTL